MPKLIAIPGGKDGKDGKDGKAQEKTFSLTYGLRLYPADQIDEIEQAIGGEVRLRDGSSSRIPLHIIEGTRDQIRAQLLASIDAFFDIYSDKALETSMPSRSQTKGAEDTGC